MSDDPKLPKEFVDAHHHFIDTEQEFNSFLRSFAGKILYTPEQYEADVKDCLAKMGVKLLSSVHVEAMPDRGEKEVEWVEGFIAADKCHTVKAIVGSVDLAGSDAGPDMAKLKEASSKVRGVRWMVDCVGKFEGGKTATHVATTRHDGVDYLRGSGGGYGGDVVPAFEAGYKLLAEHGLSFDLQCAPAQLKQGAALASRHPDVPLVIDHLGKPRIIFGEDENNGNTVPDEEELKVWREGMKAMAAVPHVYVKISMIGYVVPGWIKNPDREAVLRDLVKETIDLFGAKRCMVASNWWVNASASDCDFLSENAPSPSELITKLSSWFSDYSEEDLDRLFSGTAKDFYRIEE